MTALRQNATKPRVTTSRALWVMASAIGLLLLVAIAWMYSIRPVEPEVRPDSPEALRKLMHSGARPERLAAMILLIKVDDPEGSRAFLEAFPSMRGYELSRALGELLTMPDKSRLSPAIIDAFLDASANPERESFQTRAPGYGGYHCASLYNAIGLIVPGRESAHTAALFRAIKRSAQRRFTQRPYVTEHARWESFDALARTGDPQALQYCRTMAEKIGKRITETNWQMHGVWARLIVHAHGAKARQAYENIEKKYPRIAATGFKKTFLRELNRIERGEPRTGARNWLSEHQWDYGEQDRAMGIPWVLRRNRVRKAISDLRFLQRAVDAYFVDCSTFPPRQSALTTPIAYIDRSKSDVCAPSGSYCFAFAHQSGHLYALASTGPDGVRNISLAHLMLTRDLQGILPLSPGDTLFVRSTPNGYEFLTECVPGADIVVFHRHRDRQNHLEPFRSPE